MPSADGARRRGWRPSAGERVLAYLRAASNVAVAEEPKGLSWVPGRHHTTSREVAGPEYERRVVDFFRRSFGE
jgi:hypothetical protein